MTETTASPVPGIARSEMPLWLGIVTTLVLMSIGANWFADLSDPVVYFVLFAWLFAVMLWLSFAVVRHADCLAIKLGEPYGTLILTVSVISIEVIMIAAVMLGLAEIELEFRAERQAAGIEVAKKKGVYRGRQKGTTKAKPQRAAELRAKGLKLDEIAQALGTSRRTVQRYLGD